MLSDHEDIVENGSNTENEIGSADLLSLNADTAENNQRPLPLLLILAGETYKLIECSAFILNGYGLAAQAPLIMAQGWQDKDGNLPSGVAESCVAAGGIALALGAVIITPEKLDAKHPFFKGAINGWRMLAGAGTVCYFTTRLGLTAIIFFTDRFGTENNAINLTNAEFFSLLGGGGVVGTGHMTYRMWEELVGPIENKYIKALGYLFNSILYASLFHASLDQGLTLFNQFNPSPHDQAIRFSASGAFSLLTLMASYKAPKTTAGCIYTLIALNLFFDVVKIIAGNEYKNDIDEAQRMEILAVFACALLGPHALRGLKKIYDYFSQKNEIDAEQGYQNNNNGEKERLLLPRESAPIPIRESRLMLLFPPPNAKPLYPHSDPKQASIVNRTPQMNAGAKARSL